MFRLRELRKAKGISMKKLGEIIGVAESTISLYELEKREPDFSTLKKLADYFNVTTDYLLGREEIPVALSIPNGYENLTEEEKEIINNLIEKFGKDR